MRSTRAPLAGLLLALACAAPRPAARPVAPAAAPAPAAAAPAPPPAVARGMNAAALRRALGAPQRVESIGSSVAPGTSYERWVYPGREVVLLDGKVVDAVP